MWVWFQMFSFLFESKIWKIVFLTHPIYLLLTAYGINKIQTDLAAPQNANIAAAFEIDVHRLLTMIDLTETIKGATLDFRLTFGFRVYSFSILPVPNFECAFFTLHFGSTSLICMIVLKHFVSL